MRFLWPLSLVATLSTCEKFDEFSDSLGDSLSQQPAVADSTPIGFDLENKYPSRNTSRDGYHEHVGPELSKQQLNRLFEHVAFPQSQDALISLLGRPFYAENGYAYWKIQGGSNELAVRIIDGTAYSYTVGY